MPFAHDFETTDNVILTELAQIRALLEQLMARAGMSMEDTTDEYVYGKGYHEILPVAGATYTSAVNQYSHSAATAAALARYHRRLAAEEGYGR